MKLTLQIRGLEVSYRDAHHAVRGIDLDVAEGEALALVGESGCGKSSSVRAILGLLGAGTRVRGEILLEGEDLISLPPRRRRDLASTRLGYVAQDPYAAYDPLRTVRHHVQEPWLMHGHRPDRAEVARQLANIGIPEAAERSGQHPHQWSGGMLQRATIVASTALSPALTVADEPTSALDIALADEVMGTLRARSSALLFVTHDLALAARHADRLVVMHAGKVIETGPPDQVLNSPRHEQTQRLVAAARPRPRRNAARVDSREPTLSQACVVQALDISRTYEVGALHQNAVNRVSLTVRRGEIVGIVGASGSGKSTLLRLLAGTERPDSGTVTHGPDGAEQPRPGAVMPIFQDPVASLDPRWPLWRTITEPLTARQRLPRHTRRTAARAMLDRVGLEAINLESRPGQLSVGQAQRVAIARALIAEPDLIVADEPTASLDGNSAQEIITMLREISDSRGVAQLLVSHDVTLLESVADRVLLMQAGNLTVPGQLMAR